MNNARLFSFVGGAHGGWRVTSCEAVKGDSLPAVARIDIRGAQVDDLPASAGWVLRGVISNDRYATRAEKQQLLARQAGIGRPEATRGALIPIRKSAAWWALTQDERRSIFEETSAHTRVGLRWLPAIARRLHHCRDLEGSEPFDFLTFFDFAPAEANAFEDLVAALRVTEEWRYVEREVDIRMTRDGA